MVELLHLIDDRPGPFDKVCNIESCKRSLLRQLHHHGVAHAQSRAQLPGLHEKREVPGYDLATHSDRLVPGVAQEVAIHRHGLAMVLVSPASVVPETLDGETQICIVGISEGLPVVETLETGEVVSVGFNQIS